MKIKIEDRIMEIEHSTFIQLIKQDKIPPWSLVKSRIVTDGNWRRLEDLELFKLFTRELPYKEEAKSIEEIFASLAAEKSKVSDEVQFFSYQSKLPVLTLILVAINVGIFLIQTLAGGSTDIELLVKFGAYTYDLITHNKEYWRLISHTFLHIGLLHLVINMGVLYIIGMTLERLYGKSRFLILYFVSGLAGGIASLIFVKGPVGAGASGAIFGLVGAMVTFGIQYRAQIPNRQKRGFGLRLVPFIVADLIIGIAIPGVNIAAHIGGLIGGFAIAWLLYPTVFRKSWREEKPFIKIIAVSVAGIMLLCEILVGINFPTRDKFDTRTKYEQILDQYEAALDRAYNPDTYAILEQVYMTMREKVPEKEDKWNKNLEKLYSKAISKDSKNPTWYNNFAWLYVQMDVKSDEAISLALKSLEFSHPDKPTLILDTLAWAYLRDSQYKKALNRFEEIFDREPPYKKDIWESSWNGVLEIARSDVKREIFMDFYDRMAGRSELRSKLDWVLNEFQITHE